MIFSPVFPGPALSESTLSERGPIFILIAQFVGPLKMILGCEAKAIVR
jgi:hypothetical protein